MSQTNPPSQEWRARLLAAALDEAPDAGWTQISLQRAAATAGLDKGQAEWAAPRGAADLLDLFEDMADQAMLDNAGLGSNSLRGRVRTLIMARFAYMQRHREALRRAASPSLAAEAPRRLWRTADRIWRRLNDPSTDGNFYSKRTILTGVLGASMLVFLNDDTADLTETEAFVARRLDDVMAFEKAKAAVGKALAPAEGLLDALAKLRYGR
ncbi:MAG: COQ9 family protein [Caulobacterales bacterium]